MGWNLLLFEEKLRGRGKWPWTNKDNASLREALALNIANGRPFDSPILGTQLPKGIEQIGCWRIGKEAEECL